MHLCYLKLAPSANETTKIYAGRQQIKSDYSRYNADVERVACCLRLSIFAQVECEELRYLKVIDISADPWFTFCLRMFRIGCSDRIVTDEHNEQTLTLWVHRGMSTPIFFFEVCCVHLYIQLRH